LDLLPRKITCVHDDEALLLQVESVPHLLDYLVDREVNSVQYVEQGAPSLRETRKSPNAAANAEINLDAIP